MGGTELERLLRRQRTLGWGLSIAIFVITVSFFGLMGTGASVMQRVVWGHSTTLANVAAVAFIMLLFLSIVVYGRLSDRIDELGAKGS